MADNVAYKPAPYPTLDNAGSRYFSGEFRAISNAITSLSGPWTAYTPTITAQTGAFTTVSASGRFKKMGKTVFVQISITITTNGTAAGSVLATLPHPNVQGMLGYGVSVTNSWALTGGGAPGNQVAIVKYDGTYPGGTGVQLAFAGFYEVN